MRAALYCSVETQPTAANETRETTIHVCIRAITLSFAQQSFAVPDLHMPTAAIQRSPNRRPAYIAGGFLGLQGVKRKNNKKTGKFCAVVSGGMNWRFVQSEECSPRRHGEHRGAFGSTRALVYR